MSKKSVAPNSLPIGENQALWMYECMYKSRRYEERIATVYMEGKQPLFNMANGPIPGEMHLSNGQEPVAVGVCAHLTNDDYVTATHRPHHIAIAKGVDLVAMTAEIFGKASGLSGGRGGHMHLFDPAVNFACSGIIAQGMGPAAGAALARAMRREPGISVAFIGEGAANQGAFHEVMNLAAVWQLPFICIIEDNGWGISVSKQKSTAVPRNHIRAAAYGVPGEYVEGNDPIEIYLSVGRAVDRARRGDGPSLIEIQTTRLSGHFLGDAQAYREKEEFQLQQGNDPIPKFRSWILEVGYFNEAHIRSIEKSADEAIERAFSLARQANYPPPESAFDCIFVGDQH